MLASYGNAFFPIAGTAIVGIIAWAIKLDGRVAVLEKTEDSKLEGLEKLINTKFDAQDKRMDSQDKRLERIENNLDNLRGV